MIEVNSPDSSGTGPLRSQISFTIAGASSILLSKRILILPEATAFAGIASSICWGSSFFFLCGDFDDEVFGGKRVRLLNELVQPGVTEARQELESSAHPFLRKASRHQAVVHAPQVSLALAARVRVHPFRLLCDVEGELEAL